MLLRNFGRLALAAVTALVPSVLAADDKAQSTFVSPGGEVAFGITVPDHGNRDVYISLRVPLDVSWGAVGLGSPDMPGALFLIIYQNDKGDNVTFSPRMSFGHHEPWFYEALQMEVLEGTGIFDDHMVFVGRCIEHCRSWESGGTNSGYMDTSSNNVDAIYAFGPKEGYGSNKKDAPLKFHQEFGNFQIDVGRTNGYPDPPVLNSTTKNDGASDIIHRKKNQSDWRSITHAVLMIVGIVGLMPLGVVLLRLGERVRWHGLNQTLALLFVLGGFGAGISTSFYYQRSRGFHHYHQIIGVVVIGFCLAQFGIGFLHHAKFKKTQQGTKYGLIHVWMGRIILFLGTLNAFIGFTFALNRRRGSILAGIIIFVCVGSLIFLFWKKYQTKRSGPLRHGPGGAPQGYPREPWRQQPSPNPSYPSGPPPGYEPPSSQDSIGLRPVSPSPWRRSTRDDDDDDVNLGPQQRPKDVI